MREVGNLPSLTVVVCSLRARQETVEECYRLGASAYYVKPDDYEGLLRFAERVGAFRGTDEATFPSG